MKKTNYTKKDIVKNLSDKTGFSINFSKKLNDDLLGILKNYLKEGQINYKNLGSFKLIKKRERMGRNPKTGEKFVIKPRIQVSFKLSSNLIKSIRNFE